MPSGKHDVYSNLPWERVVKGGVSDSKAIVRKNDRVDDWNSHDFIG